MSPRPRVPPQGDIAPGLLRQEDPDAQGTMPDTQCHPKATKFLGGDLGSPLALGALSPACTPCTAAFGGVYTPRASEGRGQVQGCPVAVAEAGGSPCTPQLGPFG